MLGFRNYALKMYTEYTRLNLPTWSSARPWAAARASADADWQGPAEFNAMLDRLATGHCPNEPVPPVRPA